MEDVFTQLSKDCASSKYTAVKKSCNDVLELLGDKALVATLEPYQLRGKCLATVQMVLDTKSSKLGVLALGSVQRMLTDDRFHSPMESEDEENWLPIQVLTAVAGTPGYNEEVQMEVMKLLLNMAFTTAWCMNAKVITKISELLLDVLLRTSKLSLRNTIINALFRIMEVIFHRQTAPSPVTVDPQVGLVIYSLSLQTSVRTAVRATLTQLLMALVERMYDKEKNAREQSAANALAEFTGEAINPSSQTESLTKDVVAILRFLCTKLEESQKPEHSRQGEPLLLEGIYAILTKLPTALGDNQDLIDLIWQHLCPTLISILGNPLTDKSVTSQKAAGQDYEVGRGSGCSTAAPSANSMSAKTIYSLSVELVRLVGSFQSLRPVLESLFHRMLLYPPAVHRHDALKAMKEILCDPERLLDLAGPTISDPSSRVNTPTVGRRKMKQDDLSLLKLLVDSISECCHCNDSAVCITSVNLINDLLTSVEALVKGHGLNMSRIQQILYEDSIPKGDGRDAVGSSHASYYTSSDSESTDTCPKPTSNHVAGSDDKQSPEGSTDHEGHSPEGSAAAPPKLHPDQGWQTYSERRRIAKKEFEVEEQRSAEQFVDQLVAFLPKALQCGSMGEADEALQRFSSDVCIALTDPTNGDGAILNADGVYLATYSALVLNLKLITCGYYSSDEKSLPMAEDQFVDSVLSTDLLVYLSPCWLAAVFHRVIQVNLLGEASFTHPPPGHATSPLIELLTDVDGLESRQIGGQLLSAFQEPDTAGPPADVTGQPLPQEEKLAIEAGLKFARRVLSVCWDGILDVLSVLVNGKSSCGITGSLALMFNAKEEGRRAREAICTSLEGLQRASRLSCSLGLQDRCGSVFAALANASCVLELEDLKRERQTQPEKKPLPSNILPTKPKLARLHAAHALSMDVVLSSGLEMGSHASDCWPHVFRCCAHISELEHTYFSSGQNQLNLPKLQQEQQQEPDLQLAGDFTESDYYGSMVVPAEPVAPTIKVADVIKQSRLEAGWDQSITSGGVLSAAQASKVLCGLSQEVDRLYEDAANQLNMTSLCRFLTELCKCSRHQLSTNWKVTADHPVFFPSSSAGGFGPNHLPATALHLYRLGDIMLKCVHSGRPLLHVMRAWSIVAPHFVEAACHRDRSISKKAVHCIHEVVTSLLSAQPELPHFHFNESLCKPFENLLCLELCDGDVQDQIVCSICELVEACTNEIKSGWRPLFGALRAVKIQYTTNEDVNEARQRHVAAVLDVFDVFLNTDNVLVFANAAVDCILCLLKYVHGPGEFEDIAEDDSDSGSDLVSSTTSEDLILPALKYLEQCCSILASMWKMPACPVFNGAHRIKADVLRIVDPIIPNMNLEAFQKQFVQIPSTDAPSSSEPDITKQPDSSAGDVTKQPDPSAGDDVFKDPIKMEDKAVDTKSQSSWDSGISNTSAAPVDNVVRDSTSHEHSPPSAKQPVDDTAAHAKQPENPASHLLSPPNTGFPHVSYECPTEGSTGAYQGRSLEEMDSHTGVLHVWFLVLEGLASTVAACPKSYQPQTLEMLFMLMRSAAQVPGGEFSLHCVNHLLLPTLQSWLRRGNQLTGYWDPGTTANFKQCAGLCTDLGVEYIVQFASVPEQQPGVAFMLRQLLAVLTECVGQPIEAVSRLGCACIRHCLLSCGPLLTEEMWQITGRCLLHAFDVSLYCLRQLITPFHVNSDNFYGDIGKVKVAVRKDVSSLDCERLRQLAQQVFLLDSQRGTSGVIDYEVEEDRSYIFLIYPPGQEYATVEPIRVTFRSVVVGLLSHQILVQTMGALLLQGAPNMVPSERTMLPTSPWKHRSVSCTEEEEAGEEEDKVDALIQDTPLPGMLRYMSTRNIMQFLECMYQSYNTATQFDARPGLKFLVQKVARAEVAANMYKQSGVSLLFYMHTLLELCAHQDNICAAHIKAVLEEPLPTAAHQAAATSPDSSQPHMAVFIHRLCATFDEVCTNYVDLYLDREGPNAADRLAEGQMLVFLLAQPEEIPTLKRDKSLKEMMAEKLRSIQKKEAAAAGDVAAAAGVGGEGIPSGAAGDTMTLEPVQLQTPGGAQLDESPPGGVLSPVLAVEETGDSSERAKRVTEDKVYTVATDKTIKSLMSEYKKRKQVHSMPTFVKATRSCPAPVRRERPLTSDPADQEIEHQQKSSIMKDGEAHLTSWIECVCNMLQLFHQLADLQYRALLPTVFNCITQLVCHCKHPRLRETLAQWTYRIGHMYGFAPPGDSLPPKCRPE